MIRRGHTGHATSRPGLGARDLLHLAICRRYGVAELLSFDRALVAAFAAPWETRPSATYVSASRER